MFNKRLLYANIARYMMTVNTNRCLLRPEDRYREVKLG